MTTLIEMVESAPRRWEAAFVVARRSKRWAVLHVAGHVAVYALILGILVVTDFK